MSSNRTIAAFAFSLTASCFAAAANASPAAAAATSVPKDTSVVVKNAPAAPSNKSCEDLKAAIDGKLKAKGVKAFTLDIVPAAEVKTEKVVGSCEAGAKKITYKRG